MSDPRHDWHHQFSRFFGADCGVDGCQRERGHIGDHRRVEEVTPKSIDRKAFGLTSEDVADFLRSNPEVMQRTEGRIHTGLDVEGTLDKAGFLMWDCPECGTRVASKYMPAPQEYDRLREALHDAMENDADQVGWDDARTTDLRMEEVHRVIDAVFESLSRR